LTRLLWKGVSDVVSERSVVVVAVLEAERQLDDVSVRSSARRMYLAGGAGSMTEADRARVLVVCTGNVCRSPLVERVLAHSVGAQIEVQSAGTAALVDSPMDRRAAAQLEAWKMDPAGFVARQVVPSMVARADLVLTATRAHRGVVAALHPPALAYTFALADFSDLVTAVSPPEPPASTERSSLLALVRLAAAQRGMSRPRPAAEVDLVDPYKRSDATFRKMVRQVSKVLPPVIYALSAAVATKAEIPRRMLRGVP
jgi:protein-tyrosine phosphatase